MISEHYVQQLAKMANDSGERFTRTPIVEHNDFLLYELFDNVLGRSWGYHVMGPGLLPFNLTDPIVADRHPEIHAHFKALINLLEP